MLSDLRYALRQLAKSRGYTAVVVLTLALGIGAATAIFSVADRVLFRPLPYPAPGQLMVIGVDNRRFGFVGSQYPVQLAAYSEHARSFSSFAALESARLNLVVDGAPRGVSVGRVSAAYFSTLGAIPAFGRAFLPHEDKPGSNHALVLSWRLWRERFGGDESVLGRTVLLDGESCRIVGVLPDDFRAPLGDAADLYQPLALQVDPAQPFGISLSVIGRLRPGVTREIAEAELAAIKLPVTGWAAHQFAEEKPHLLPLADAERKWTPTSMHWALLAAVGFLYAIACVNAANLLLVRLHGRRREFSVRLALGSGRHRLVRLLAAESAVLTTLAGIAGVLVAQWTIPVMLRLAPGNRGAPLADARLDGRALAFTVALGAVTVLLVSLAPVCRIAQARVADGLKDSGPTVGDSRRLRRLRDGLVVLQAALAVALLVGAGVMTRSVQRLQHIERGFDPTDKLAVWLELPRGAYATPETRRQFYERLDERLRAIPGVKGVAMTAVVPMVGQSSGNLRKRDGTEFYAGINPVSPGYFKMLGLPLASGRAFADAAPGRAPVAVINEAMAREYFGHEDPVGQPFAMFVGQRKEAWEVVGVVRDIREAPREKPRPQLYYPFWQGDTRQFSYNNVTSILLRVTPPANAALFDAVRRAIFAVDPLVAAMAPRLLSEAAADQISREHYTLRVLRILSALALGLTVMGLFAVNAYAVAQRAGEFGVRLAFGARPEQLFQLVLRHGLALATGGVLIGFGTAWGLTRLLQTLLYETSPDDPLVYACVALLLLAAAALGCWLPARRATRVDITRLLRAE